MIVRAVWALKGAQGDRADQWTWVVVETRGMRRGSGPRAKARNVPLACSAPIKLCMGGRSRRQSTLIASSHMGSK
eukprot:40025-Chlamydomonas_euryale.AAC.1